MAPNLLHPTLLKVWVCEAVFPIAELLLSCACAEARLPQGRGGVAVAFTTLLL